MGPARVSSISLIVSSTRLRAVTCPTSGSRSIALAAYPAYRVTRSSSSRCGWPVTLRNTVMTPARPLGPSTGTDHELVTLAARATSLNGAQAGPAPERGAERRQDEREAGRRLGRHETVGQAVQPGELAAR